MCTYNYNFCCIVPSPRRHTRHVPLIILEGLPHARVAAPMVVPMVAVDPIGLTTTNPVIRGSVDSVTLATLAS